MSRPLALADQAERLAAIAERRRNLVVDAGAGTGKTTLLVSRLVEMVAPADDARPALDIARVAAVTFTRKAAGELRLRIRERLLSDSSAAVSSVVRRDRLRRALGGIDTAHIGTVHGFADRLLRRHPVEARLSPAYDVVDDDEELARETHEILVSGSEARTLAVRLHGCGSAARAGETEATVLDYLAAGLQPQTRETEYASFAGLDALVAGLIRSRDVPLEEPPVPRFARDSFQQACKKAARRLAGVAGDHHPGRWLRRLSEELSALASEEDPVAIWPRLRQVERSAPKSARLKIEFEGDKEAWGAWQAWSKIVKGKGGEDDTPPLGDAVRRPLHRWMARRLVRLRPVVLDLYEQVKTRRGVVDQIDLLILLRDMLRDHPEVRADYQGMFDHVFVDEFQDTDPLQAEIVLFVCENGPRATRWQDVNLAPGRLTIVGDPKQSIYRFRRADVRMYADVRDLVAQEALSVTLSASFRVRPCLVDYLNERFNDVLGVPDGDRIFDPANGSVANQILNQGRREVRDSNGARRSPPVRVLQLASNDPDLTADAWREIEARALARYLRWLVEHSGLTIADATSGEARSLSYGDIAVLAMATTTLRGLFDELDRTGVPHVSRGGTLFLRDPLHRQFLLGLRAIANRDDGIAEAALLRPPFFAVDLGDLAHARALALGATTETGEGPDRVAAARAWLQEARRRRFERSPGATARALLEETGFGRFVALGPNGSQRLDRLRELCLVLEQRAATFQLDYDSVTAQMREWVQNPGALDPPPAVGVDSVQVLTIHQAKGLEFPVVVMWDSRADWNARRQGNAWRVGREGNGWLLKLADLSWNEPEERDLISLEGTFLDQERKRIVYVAATRARDFLILPRSDSESATRFVTSRLADAADKELVHLEDAYLDTRLPAWARATKSSEPPTITFDRKTERAIGVRWLAAGLEAARDRFTPMAAVTEASSRARTSAAEGPVGDAGENEREVVPSRRHRIGRFGSVFGTTVHLAIGGCLAHPEWSASQAVAGAAAQCGLAEHLEEAAGDVARALKALSDGGMTGVVGRDLFVEYPLAGVTGEGMLVRGAADLVHVSDEEIRIVDFKTDAPGSAATVATFSEYAEQVWTYVDLLRPVAAGRRISGALLFSATGELVAATGKSGGVCPSS